MLGSLVDFPRDASQTGDVTDKAEIWTYALDRHCCSTPAVHEGLVFVADCGKTVHCVDAETGKPCWTHDAENEIWASTLVADGKVYVGTSQGDFWILAADRKKTIIDCVELDSRMCGTPVAANGVLYVATLRRLWAIRKSPQ